MNEQQPEPRVCRRGHRVSIEDGTGQLARQSATGKLYTICVSCREIYKADLTRLGLVIGGWVR